MIQNIVVSLDGSDFSTRALPIGAGLADAATAGLRVVGIAATDAEFAWMYDQVWGDVKRAGLDGIDVEVLVDPDPVAALLEMAANREKVLCFATHDRLNGTAKVRHAVGSLVLERARHPVVLVGPKASVEPLEGDVVVGLDGVRDPEPLLTVGAAWALQLGSRLRLVTVYDPVPADLDRPGHYERDHGPAVDPDEYLAFVRESVAGVGVAVDTVAIDDAVSVATGLEQHLEDAPARILVLGGGHRRPTLSGGVARHLLRNVTVPLLVVRRMS